MSEVEIRGLRELKLALAKLPEKMAGRALRSAVAAGAKVVYDEAKSRVPIQTGTLKRAVMRARSRSKSNRYRETYIVGVRRGAKYKYANTKANRRKGLVGAQYRVDGSAYYWRFLEFGTSKMSARPFIRPAFESRKVEAANRITQKLKENLDKAAKEVKW